MSELNTTVVSHRLSRCSGRERFNDTPIIGYIEFLIACRMFVRLSQQGMKSDE
jgi:hypothetical protein